MIYQFSLICFPIFFNFIFPFGGLFWQHLFSFFSLLDLYFIFKAILSLQ